MQVYSKLVGKPRKGWLRDLLTAEMASPPLHSACVPSVPGWGAPAWADTPWVAEWDRSLHSLDCAPMAPSVAYSSVTGNGRSCLWRGKHDYEEAFNLGQDFCHATINHSIVV